MIAKFREQGYFQTRDSFETGVASIALPFFRDDTDPTGCIAIALPKNDLTQERCAELLPMLKEAVSKMEIT